MIGVRTVNDILIVWLLTLLKALITTDWDDIYDWGIPEIIPLYGCSDKPVGNEPDEMENNTCSPSTEGVIENASFFVRVKIDWG